jgi:hypothetical protein
MPAEYQLVDCSFCGRPNRDVHIVAGRDSLYICSVCVEKCAEILDADAGIAPPPDGWRGRWPLKSAQSATHLND